MKKIVWAAVLAFCAVNLSGCAIPEKSKVSPPSSAGISNQSSPVYIPGGSEAQLPEQSRYMDVPEQQPVIVEKNLDLMLPTAAYINDRIFEYGRKLDRWKELDNRALTMKRSDADTEQMVQCFRQLQDVLNGYSDIRMRILQAQKMESGASVTNEEIFELQKKDVAFLENSCGRMLADMEDQGAGWSQRAEGADLAQLETLIDRYAANKEYEEIIQVWLKIPESEMSRVHFRSKVIYGNALMYLHQEEKAAQIYQQVVDQMSDPGEQATDQVSLRKVLADLYTASGNYKSAVTEYKKISEDYLKIGAQEEWSKLQLSILDRAKDGSPELREFSEMLRNYLGFIPERDGYKIIWQAEEFQTSYPYSPVASNVDLIRESVLKAADNWFNGFINEVDKLAAEKKFTKAVSFLETMPIDIIDVQKQLVIKAKKEELQLAEAVENETGKMAKMQDLQDQWNNGMLLEKGGRYDEAIAVFSSLLEGEYSTKAEEKIKELSLVAAQADRRKAADFFIRFTKTTDLESKKKLLVESRKLLKNILVKYPQVEIASKVAGNIERVEQEMNKLDPYLVFTADQEEKPAVHDDGIDSAFIIPAAKAMTQEQAPTIESNPNRSVSQ